jgi:toxin-antitoxin system PIN domain toxin
MSVGLLDINVLLALTWPNHQHHSRAHAWFSGAARQGWATCSMTQLGFIRLSSNPAFTPNPVSTVEAAALMARLVQHPFHQFWSSPAAADPRIYSRAFGHQQVKDAWLLEVIRRNSGRLITFDSRLANHAEDKALVVVIPS